MILLNDTNHLGLSRLKVVSDKPLDFDTIIRELSEIAGDLQDACSIGRLPTGEWYVYAWWKAEGEPKMTSYLSLGRRKIDRPERRLTEYGFIPHIKRFAVAS